MLGFFGPMAFVNSGGAALRPAGHYVVIDELPRGMVCRAAYGARDPEREEWNPLPQWRGEKSYHPSRELQSDDNRQWYHFDAEGKTLGHLAQAISQILRGKDNPLYDPIRDVGSFVVVTNCEKVRVAGTKYHYKLYFRNLSNRPGHTKVERFRDLQRRFPERIIMRAVWGTMPKTPSCRRIFKDRLKLFAGPNHLYYHKDPIEYPMHTVKDCTPSQTLRKRDRQEHFYTRVLPKMTARINRNRQSAKRLKLKLFKTFLKEQLAKMDPEKLEGVDMATFQRKASELRYDETLDEYGGPNAKEAKKAVRLYPGTQIPRKRVSKNLRSLQWGV